jgi:hypothetical protein
MWTQSHPTQRGKKPRILCQFGKVKVKTDRSCHTMNMGSTHRYTNQSEAVQLQINYKDHSTIGHMDYSWLFIVLATNMMK